MACAPTAGVAGDQLQRCRHERSRKRLSDQRTPGVSLGSGQREMAEEGSLIDRSKVPRHIDDDGGQIVQPVSGDGDHVATKCGHVRSEGYDGGGEIGSI